MTSRPGSNAATAVYSVSSASKSDEGSYVCEANNEAGTREEMVQVVIVDGGGGGGNVIVDGGGAAGNMDGGGGTTQVDRQQFTAPLGGNAELRCFLVGECKRLANPVTWIFYPPFNQ